MPTSVFLNLSQGGEQFTGQLIGPAADNTAAPPFTFAGDLTSGLASAATGETDLMAAGTKALALTASAATFVTGTNLINKAQSSGTTLLVDNTSTNVAAFAQIGVENGTGSSYLTLYSHNHGTFPDHAQLSATNLDLNSSAAMAFYVGTYDATHQFMSLSTAGILTFLNSGYPNPTTEAVGSATGKAGALYVNPATDIAGIRIDTSNETVTDRALQVIRSSAEVMYISQTGGIFGPGITPITDTVGDIGASGKRLRDAWFSRSIGLGVSPTGSTGVFSFSGSLQNSGTNGQILSMCQTLTELTTIAAAASTDTTIQMPANSVVLAVSVRVTVVIPTAVSFTVGDSGSAARFSTAAVSTAATSTDAGTKAGAYYNATALSVRITPNAQPADNSGRVRVSIFYYTSTPPTS